VAVRVVGCTDMVNSSIETHRYRGFTLVELLVTLVIVSMLLLAGSFLTISWTDRGKVNDTVSIIKSSISIARALAIRNERALLSDEPSVSICINYQDNTIKLINVLKPLDVCENYSSDDVIKYYEFAKGIKIKQNDRLVSCFLINASGLINEDLCQTNLVDEITVKKRNEKLKFKFL
jgi:type IV pilus assembly protein PilA